MRLMVMNKVMADKIRGAFRRHKGRESARLEPVKVEDGMFILNLDAIINIQEKLRHSKYEDLIKDKLTKFTVGDNSALDQKYQAYLINQQEI